jgi:hypothetical protein
MATYNPTVNVATVSVNSATVPVSLVAPGFVAAALWIKNRVASAVPVLIFPYTTAAPPNAAPSNTYELAPNSAIPFHDALSSAASGADAGLGVGWAAVLESGNTACTVDVIWR